MLHYDFSHNILLTAKLQLSFVECVTCLKILIFHYFFRRILRYSRTILKEWKNGRRVERLVIFIFNFVIFKISCFCSIWINLITVFLDSMFSFLSFFQSWVRENATKLSRQSKTYRRVVRYDNSSEYHLKINFIFFFMFW